MPSKLNSFTPNLTKLQIKNATKISVMSYFCAISWMHKIQITQERSEYDFMTSSMKFMQQMASTLSESDSSVCK